jgi:hypothetical protein
MGKNYRGGYLQQGAVMPRVSFTKLLSADNQAINPNKGTLCTLQSDNTTATNRTFTLLDGQYKGQDIILNFISGSSYSCDLQDTGNVSLVEAWQPLEDECLHLMWNGTKWVELGRSETGIVAGSIVNADINASAAIDYSKLNLTGNLVAADFSADSGALRLAAHTVTAAQLVAAGTGVPVVSGGVIPDNSVIVKAWYEVKTTFAGDGDDSSTLSIGIEDQDVDLVGAAAIKTGTPWDATGVVIETLASDIDDPSTFIKTTAARQIAVTLDILTTDVTLTQGEMTVTCLYIPGV